jgi:hypothetical protein
MWTILFILVLVAAIVALVYVVFKFGKADKVPEWVLAIATALQTIAIIATLAVAYREWSSHELASKQAKIDNVLKLYSDEPTAVSDARVAIAKHSGALVCMKMSPDMLCKKELDEQSPKLFQSAWPMLTRIAKVSACVDAGLCEAEMARKLFCGDAREMDLAFKEIGLREIRLGGIYDLYVQSFVTQCGPMATFPPQKAEHQLK